MFQKIKVYEKTERLLRDRPFSLASYVLIDEKIRINTQNMIIFQCAIQQSTFRKSKWKWKKTNEKYISAPLFILFSWEKWCRNFGMNKLYIEKFMKQFHLAASQQNIFFQISQLCTKWITFINGRVKNVVSFVIDEDFLRNWNMSLTLWEKKLDERWVVLR